MTVSSVISLSYIAFVFLVGYLLSKKHKTSGVRAPSVSVFTATASLCAAFIGGGFSLGNAEYGFTGGLNNAFLLCGFSAGQLVSALLFSPLIASFKGCDTVGGIIGRSFGETARRFSGVLSVIFCTGVLGAQINAFGSVASYLLGANRTLCSVIAFSGLILFSALGGISASVKTDGIQVCVLLVCVLLAFVAAMKSVGGFHSLMLVSPPGFFEPPALGFREFIVPFLTFGFGELLCPPSVKRILLAENKSAARLSTALSALVSVPFFFITSLIGILARFFFPLIPSAFAMPSVVSEFLLFPLNAVACGAMLCVYLSSGCAFLLSCSDALFFDIIPKKYRQNERLSVGLLRGANVVCGTAALLISLAFNEVLSILVLAYCFWCPVMFVPLVAALQKKRYPPSLFFGSAGAATAAILLFQLLKEPHGISPLLAGLTASLAAFIILLRGKKT